MEWKGKAFLCISYLMLEEQKKWLDCIKGIVGLVSGK